MTRDEVLTKIQEARKAIEDYKKQGLNSTTYESERQKVLNIQQESMRLITEARTIGAAGSACPRCGGSGRV